jgi:hypothetical protein
VSKTVSPKISPIPRPHHKALLPEAPFLRYLPQPFFISDGVFMQRMLILPQGAGQTVSWLNGHILSMLLCSSGRGAFHIAHLISGHNRYLSIVICLHMILYKIHHNVSTLLFSGHWRVCCPEPLEDQPLSTIRIKITLSLFISHYTATFFPTKPFFFSDFL